MPRPRLLYGTLAPDTTLPFALRPEDTAGGDGGAGAPVGDPPAPPAAAADGDGFPPNTPVDQMTAPQQAAYWKHYARKHESDKKELAKTLDANREKIDGYDRLVEASKTEQERAIEEARKAATAAGRAEMVPHLLQAEFVAAAAGKLTREQAVELVAPLNAAHFLDDQGRVDTAKVTAYVGKYIGVAAPGPSGSKLPAGFPDLAQGRKTTATVTGKEAGLAEAARRGYVTSPQQQTA